MKAIVLVFVLFTCTLCLRWGVPAALANALNPYKITEPKSSIVVLDVAQPLNWGQLQLAIYNGYDYNTRQTIKKGQLLNEPSNWDPGTNYQGDYHASLYYNGQAVPMAEAQGGIPTPTVGDVMMYCKVPVARITYYVTVELAPKGKSDKEQQPQMRVELLDVRLTDGTLLTLEAPYFAAFTDTDHYPPIDFCAAVKNKITDKYGGNARENTQPAAFGPDDLPPGLQGPLLVSLVGALALVALLLRRHRLQASRA